MLFILSDHNCEGQADAIFTVLRYRGYTTLLDIELRLFRDVGLDLSADDEIVWKFCQGHGYLLLTGNRSSADGKKSLESVIQRFMTPTSLPVLTIGDLKRVKTDAEYCRRCAEHIAEIVMDLDTVLGTIRLYVPWRT